MKKLLLIAMATLALGACSGGQQQTQADTNPGPNSQMRSTTFKKLGGAMHPIGDVIQGKQAFDAEDMKAKAAAFEAAAQEPFKHFAKDTTGTDGKARPEVWQKPEEFKAAEEKFLKDVKAFNEAAQTGDFDKVKQAFGPAASNCKSCHDAFKLK